MSRPIEVLDEALERVSRVREQVAGDLAAPHRAERLAMTFESEARIWSQLFELASHRLVWRAALAAEARARTEAAVWWRQAIDDGAPAVFAADGAEAIQLITPFPVEV